MTPIPPRPDAIPPPPDTDPAGRMTNSELHDSLKAHAEEIEQRREAKAAERHRIVIDRFATLEGRVDGHDKEIAQVRRAAFPQAPLWALVTVIAVAACGFVGVSYFEMRAIEHYVDGPQR